MPIHIPFKPYYVLFGAIVWGLWSKLCINWRLFGQLCYFLNFNISLMFKSAIFLFIELAYLDKANKLTPFDGASQYGSGTLSYDGGNSNPSKNSGFFILNPLNLDDGSTVPTAF